MTRYDLEFELDETKEEEFIVAMGKTVVFMDKVGLTARQIVEIYDARNTKVISDGLKISC